MRKTVKQLLDEKGHSVWSVKPDATVFEAVKIMEHRKVGAMPVVENGRMVGIVSERDCVRRIILKGKSYKATKVKAIMTKRVFYVAPERTADECMALMTEERIRHLPVFDGPNLIGVISIGDVVRATIAEKQFIIEQLEKYITS
jgi:CBS domain-containing protein